LTQAICLLDRLQWSRTRCQGRPSERPFRIVNRLTPTQNADVTADVRYLGRLSGSCRPEAATDLHDQFKWNIHWSAREESHDDGPCVLAMLNDPAVA